MEKAAIQLTPAEWQIMEQLWDGSKTLMELVGQLKESVGWAKSTVSTMVVRMEMKKLLSYDSVGRTRHYYPLVSREDAVVDATNTLLDRAYKGSLGMLVSTMIRQNGLNKADIAELYDILSEVEEK